MTWFEAEEIDIYLKKLERMLDEWRMAPMEMRIEAAELSRVREKVEVVSNDDTQNPVLREYLSEMKHRIETCKRQIRERLKRK